MKLNQPIEIDGPTAELLAHWTPVKRTFRMSATLSLQVVPDLEGFAARVFDSRAGTLTYIASCAPYDVAVVACLSYVESIAI